MCSECKCHAAPVCWPAAARRSSRAAAEQRTSLLAVRLRNRGRLEGRRPTGTKRARGLPPPSKANNAKSGFSQVLSGFSQVLRTPRLPPRSSEQHQSCSGRRANPNSRANRMTATHLATRRAPSSVRWQPEAAFRPSISAPAATQRPAQPCQPARHNNEAEGV